MKHEIIFTEHYALIVSDEKVEEGSFIYETNVGEVSMVDKWYCEILEKGAKVEPFVKVIAHRPLTDAPILKGVPLLPEFSEEEYVAELSLKTYPFGNPERNAFITGYNKAKETYKYTEEDLVEAYERGMNNIDSDGCHIDQPADDFTEFIQSLQQLKRPKYFEMFYSSYKIDVDGNHVNELAIRTTPQGQTELVGEYSYE